MFRNTPEPLQNDFRARLRRFLDQTVGFFNSLGTRVRDRTKKKKKKTYIRMSAASGPSNAELPPSNRSNAFASNLSQVFLESPEVDQQGMLTSPMEQPNQLSRIQPFQPFPESSKSSTIESNESAEKLLQPFANIPKSSRRNINGSSDKFLPRSNSQMNVSKMRQAQGNQTDMDLLLLPSTSVRKAKATKSLKNTRKEPKRSRPHNVPKPPQQTPSRSNRDLPKPPQPLTRNADRPPAPYSRHKAGNIREVFNNNSKPLPKAPQQYISRKAVGKIPQSYRNNHSARNLPQPYPSRRVPEKAPESFRNSDHHREKADRNEEFAGSYRDAARSRRDDPVEEARPPSRRRKNKSKRRRRKRQSPSDEVELDTFDMNLLKPSSTAVQQVSGSQRKLRERVVKTALNLEDADIFTPNFLANLDSLGIKMQFDINKPKRRKKKKKRKRSKMPSIHGSVSFDMSLRRKDPTSALVL